MGCSPGGHKESETAERLSKDAHLTSGENLNNDCR